MTKDAEHELLKIYRKLWSRIGGRHWTFIMRDIWHQLEYLPTCILILIGFVVGQYFDWLQLLCGWGIFTIGYIAGHLFWGERYITGQEGEEPK